MKKIAYIEIDTHAEIVGDFMELMSDSKEFAVDYFLSEKVLRMTGKHAKNIKISEAASILEQLKNTKYDLVIIGTVHRYFNIFGQICDEHNTSIICHNLNFTEISKIELLQSIFKKDFKFRLKLLIKEDLLSVSDVYRKAKNLLVLDENLSLKRFKFLPVFFTKVYEKTQNKIMRIVVPGSVSQERRNYRHILEKIKNFGELRRSEEPMDSIGNVMASSVGAKLVFEIIFLGKSSGYELKMIEETQTPKNIKFRYSTEKIPVKIFNEEMMKANVLWCPIQNETEFFSQKEIYGVTKMSGNIGDAIKFGKKAVFPKNFKNNYPFIFPEEDNVGSQLFNADELMDYDFFEKYSKEKVLANLESVLEDLIKN